MKAHKTDSELPRVIHTTLDENFPLCHPERSEGSHSTGTFLFTSKTIHIVEVCPPSFLRFFTVFRMTKSSNCKR